ncbi:MAG: dTMP kinase [Burkholderiaceae bacterium]|nr:dTMP kinase [Burkholderiaceae bacterium]
MTERGRFITFEGIDGAGKSSHLTALAEWLRARGREVLVTREPGGTPLAESLRTLFLQHAMDPLTEALLVFAGRRDHLNAVVWPALARGAIVLCDRFSDATFAYQGGGRGFDAGVLTQLEAWVQRPPGAPAGELVQPELTLWFDLPPAVAAGRRAAARDADRLEREDAAFFERVRAGYAQRAAQAPGRFVRIDADRPPDAVWAQVQAAVAARGWL